jgi:hypothetical protein
VGCGLSKAVSPELSPCSSCATPPTEEGGICSCPGENLCIALVCDEGQRFVARQPIPDRSQDGFGFELLFQKTAPRIFDAEPELAARSTLDSSLLFGINPLCDRAAPS